MKQIGIYGFQRLGVGKWYVGQSRDMVHRRLCHLQLLRRGVHYNKLFQSAFTQGGESHFEYVVLSKLSISLIGKELRGWLDTTEKLWIQVLDAKTSGYNQTIGGAGVIGWPDPLVRDLYFWGQKPIKKRLVGKAYWVARRRPKGLRRATVAL